MYIVCVYIQYTVYYIYTHYVHTHTSIYTIHIIHMIQTFTWMQSVAKDDYTNHAQFRWKKNPPRRTTSRVPWTTLAARSLIFDRWSQWTTDMIYVHRTLGRLCHVSFYMFPYSTDVFCIWWTCCEFVVSLVSFENFVRFHVLEFRCEKWGRVEGLCQFWTAATAACGFSFWCIQTEHWWSTFWSYSKYVQVQIIIQVNINKGFLFISCWICWMNISALWMSMGIPFFRWAADLYGVEVIELLCSAYEGFWYVSHQELTYMKRYDMKRYDMKGYA